MRVALPGRMELWLAARAISDGVACSAIYDVAVDPALQGQGVGRALTALLARLPKRSVMLVSTMGNEDFYRKLGFRKMRTAYILMEDFAAGKLARFGKHNGLCKTRYFSCSTRIVK